MTPNELRELRARLIKNPRLVTELEPEVVEALYQGEFTTGSLLDPGDLPGDIALERAQALDRPSFLITQVLDPFYKKHFEPCHYRMCDEVIGPFVVGETVRIDGVNYDPHDYLGLIVLKSRGVFKSSVLGLMVLWTALYRKIRQGVDARAMYVHQVLQKAIDRGEVLRNIARHHRRFRERFPEFARPPGEWDKQEQWRWPCFDTFMASEWSFRAYGETSDKTGGHYTEHWIDDWETEESVTTPTQIDNSEKRFRMMDNLDTLSEDWTPRMLAGTPYHYAGLYKTLEKEGGWLIVKVPAHGGSSVSLFDLCEISDRTKEGRRKIEVGLRKLETERADDLNYPNLLPWRKLYRKARAQGRYIYNCQQQLEPVPEGQQRFDPVALDDSWVTELLSPEEMWLYIRCDPAVSKKRENDDTAIHLAGVRWNGERHFLYSWSGHEKRPTRIVRHLFRVAREWMAKGYSVRSIGIESVAYQEALAQLCRDGVPEREAAYHGESVPVLLKPCAVRSIQRSGDMRKQERIIEMDGPVTRREFKVWKGNPGGAKLIQRMKNYPFDRDDDLDAAADMWGDGIYVPPRERPVEEPRIPPVMMALIRAAQENPNALVGGTNQVRLAHWRN